MTHKQILTKAIKQAIANGWDFNGLLAPMDPGRYEVIAPFEGNYLRIKTVSGLGDESFDSINAVIYNHDFARALWGNKEMIAYKFHSALARNSSNLLESGAYFIWQFHLQQMVIADDAIAYLGQNI